MDINKKTFDLVVRTRETFSLYLYNFQMAVTFFFRIRDRVRITFVSKLTTKLSTILNLKKVRLIISPKFKESVSLILNLKRVSFVYSIKERLKAITTITTHMPVSLIIRERQKIVSTIKQGILSLTTSPILAKFFLLSDYDLDILGDLDASTLGDMDYIIT